MSFNREKAAFRYSTYRSFKVQSLHSPEAKSDFSLVGVGPQSVRETPG